MRCFRSGVHGLALGARQRAWVCAVLSATGLLHGGAAHASPVSGCQEPTTLAQSECRGQQIDQAQAKLQRYLDAARQRAALFRLDSAAFDAEQRAWEHYRTRLCGNVHAMWAQGSIRHEMFAQCVLQATAQRTTDVWRAYLTYADGSAPVLPDPAP